VDAASTANLIAGGALVVSVAVAARGEVARRSGAELARRADAAAGRSAEAAERSAVALEKMADEWAEFMSRQEKREQRQWSRPASGGPEAELRGEGAWAGSPSDGVGPTEPVVHWTVDRVEGRRHLLTNLGPATAFAVELTGENAVRFDGPTEPRDMQMGESVEFLAIGSMQTGTPELVVSWQDAPAGNRMEWRRPLP
jgi:hypothetical protein